MIQGGWEFVWAAYGVTISTFVLYGLSLMGRLRAQAKIGKEEP